VRHLMQVSVPVIPGGLKAWLRLTREPAWTRSWRPRVAQRRRPVLVWQQGRHRGPKQAAHRAKVGALAVLTGGLDTERPCGTGRDR
jgi:hypothetical protein